MAHVVFGVACCLGALWVFVEVLNDQPGVANGVRIRTVSRLTAAVMWVAFVVGGWWYVVYYKADKNLILNGPWPFAHHLVMETKEHLAIILLLLATYLPIAADNELTANPPARRLVLWVAALTALLALLMEGEGGVISLGVRVALQANQ